MVVTMTMGQSNSMWRAKKQFTLSDLSESGSVLSSFLAWHLFHCVVHCLSSALLFSYFSCSTFFCTRLCFCTLFIFSLMSVFPFSHEPSVLVLPSFPWLRYLPLRVRPPPSASNYYLAPDLFLFTPTTAFSICHPAPPSTRVPLCICMILRSLR